MSNVLEIKKDIYYTGVLDKDLEVFDIIMETEFGTTYNSYLIKDEKTVLIDTVKSNFKDIFFEKIEAITPIENIDYIVVHHTEPDHASSLSYILERNPDAVVYCTTAAKNYLTNQLNRDFKFKTIKDGEVLNIGKRNLRFITAPMLHWADTMFTYVEEDKVLFTCDAFGCHYGDFDPECVKNNEDYIKASKEKEIEAYLKNSFKKYKEQGIDVFDIARLLNINYPKETIENPISITDLEVNVELIIEGTGIVKDSL